MLKVLIGGKRSNILNFGMKMGENQDFSWFLAQKWPDLGNFERSQPGQFWTYRPQQGLILTGITSSPCTYKKKSPLFALRGSNLENGEKMGNFQKWPKTRNFQLHQIWSVWGPSSKIRTFLSSLDFPLRYDTPFAKKNFGTRDAQFRPFWLTGDGRNGQISAARPKSALAILKSIKSCIGNHLQNLCTIFFNTRNIFRTVLFDALFSCTR